ncbi:MAG: hypothetical protein PUG85_04905 [Oscillospiraceae bacterium]|nr:hypothetical protein [Oscillospiraceae bacterium]
MSTRELVHTLVDGLSEEQLRGLVLLLQNQPRKETTLEEVQGILSAYANPDLISLEETAWESAVKEKYENS